jgi:hypothetical protein
MIALQKQITDQQKKKFLPTHWDHTAFEQQIQLLRNDLDEPRKTPGTVGTDEDLRMELDDMIRDPGQASKESRSLSIQLANVLSLAAWAALSAPPQPEDRGPKFPDSPDISASDRTQVRCWIAQLRMIIRDKPNRFPNDQSKMRYAFNRLSGLALKQILPHVRDD